MQIAINNISAERGVKEEGAANTTKFYLKEVGKIKWYSNEAENMHEVK